MLVLSRKKNEAIQIDDNIEIQVLAIEGDQVKLGISAPKTTDIYRMEIYMDIQKQNSEAANVSLDVIQLLSDEVDEE
ncbi:MULTISPECIES: carbon storage regulator CsrA [unclassified Virgibacillus]|uniref:carbon storage regulator CsrA n=1 Tax=unclassified Virgibacillus TaxID=2620237 RepID=UPI0024DEC1C4|nr:carbon storage regulator CsrA [Virgibacillus sp. LDC-1]